MAAVSEDDVAHRHPYLELEHEIPDSRSGPCWGLLEAAQRRESVERARVVAFARACLELTEAGRLALAVLDGGVFAPRRALELAAMVAAAPGVAGRKASGEP